MWRILRSAIAGCLPLAVAAGSVRLFTIDAMADISLFTTQEDFTGWDGGTSITATPIATSLDGSTINGVGNHTSPGAAGTNGGLLVDWNSGGWINFTSQDPASRANFIAALGSTDTGAGLVGASGMIKFDYTKPTTLTGDYFQLGIFFNYDGGWGPATGTETDNGNGTFTATIPYTINDTTASGHTWWWQFGLHYNSNFDPADTFVIDNVRVVQVPEPAALGLLSLGGIAMFRRRRA